MIAVFVNMATVLFGSLLGILFRSKIRKAWISVVISAIGLVTIVIGIKSAAETADILCMIVCMAVGTFVGTVLRFTERLDGAGEWIKRKLAKGLPLGEKFTEGFVSSCILFCIGSMTIMGSFEAGVNGDYSIILAKSAMDFVSSMMFGAAMGFGVTCSVVFILVFQGGLTLLAGVLSPVLTEQVVTEMSAVGGAVLIGLGLNLLELSARKIKVANMLLAIFLPAAYVPLSNLITGALAG